MAGEVSASSPAPASSADPSRPEMKEDSITTQAENPKTEASDEKESNTTEAKEPNDENPAASDLLSETPTKPLEENSAPAEENSEIKEDDDAPKPSGSANATQPGTNGSSKKPKRKSAGIPEHKTRSLKKKTSKAALTNLDAQPGDLFTAHLKGFPPWPAIIADEDMLPEKLLKNRPAAAKQRDGTYREAYQDGGKKFGDRAFPIMFLQSNDFVWIPSSGLKKLSLEECRTTTEKGKKKELFAAFQIAAENHDLQYFKDLLAEHIEAMQTTAETKASKKSKNKKRVDTAPEDEAEDEEAEAEEPVEDEDVEMEDAPEDADMEEPEVEEEIPVKPKSKKRKKGTDSDGDAVPTKPAKAPKRSESIKKAPKVKLNVTPKATNGVAASKPKAPAKAAKAKKSPPKVKEPSEETEESVPEEEKPLTEAEKNVKREKAILFLRHKLQKGFLTRDQMPKPEEMTLMDDFITRLEDYYELEATIIRSTKINKVLKGIIKLSSIPKDEEYRFRQRSIDLLGAWNKILASSPEPFTKERAITNGNKDGGAESGLTAADPNDETADLSMLPDEDTVMENNTLDTAEAKPVETEESAETTDEAPAAEEVPAAEVMAAEITV